MELKPALKKLEENRDFKEWKSKNKSCYLSYAFKIPQDTLSEEWQLGFYNKKKDKITTFIVSVDAIKIRPEEEVFKKDKMQVNEIKLDKVKLTFDTIILRANEFQEKNFPHDKSIKTIAILQNIAELGDVWNITYLTESFKTLNMKIDASNGKVIKHNLYSVFDFSKQNS
ncbi:hypothetical protein HYW99_00365 [Candidatus Woesearchaeota archaeon]|nr:hypothetical protein [Candidatus Woesearchaeota archaeon]